MKLSQLRETKVRKMEKNLNAVGANFDESAKTVAAECLLAHFIGHPHLAAGGKLVAL